ncbi:MAG: metallophosphoesterase [Candidatus Nanohaloarchaea archaeon]
MKILVVGDCHGEKPEIPEEDFDLVLAVGDICGGTDEMRSAMFEASESGEGWYDVFGEEEARKAVEASIEEGREILEKLDSLGVPVFIVPGNWDWTGENSDWVFLKGRGFPEMLKDFENIYNINFSGKSFGGLSFIGYGPCSGPEIPQYEDDKLGEELKQNPDLKEGQLQILEEAEEQLKQEKQKIQA